MFMENNPGQLDSSLSAAEQTFVNFTPNISWKRFDYELKSLHGVLSESFSRGLPGENDVD